MANAIGTGGADVITGTESADLLVGRGGDDQLVGGDGQDILRGDEDGGTDPIRIAAFGDSLTSFYLLDPDEQFPVQLAHMLEADGVAGEVMNFGVGGQTAAEGLQRIDTVVDANPDIVIVEFGTNDALQRQANEVTETNLDAILQELHDHAIGIVLAGAYPNYDTGDGMRGHVDPQDAADFEAIFPRLAARYDAVLYPHFTDGVLTNPTLANGDGIHQNGAGAAYVAANILDQVETAIDRLGPNGNDVLDGGGGDDRIIGGGGADLITGGAGDDFLFGGSGADQISGGGGSDIIDGGPGSDRLTGNEGADRFVAAPGSGPDTIVDFSHGIDQLDLTAFEIRDVEELENKAQISADPTGLAVSFGNGDQVVLLGVDHLTDIDFFKG
jgi:acyl-CoA thioesterase-1